MALKRTVAVGNLLENILGSRVTPTVEEKPKLPQKKKTVKTQPVIKDRHRTAPSVKEEDKINVDFIDSKEHRTLILHVRISPSVRQKLDVLCEKSGASQADVVESLIKAAVDGRVNK